MIVTFVRVAIGSDALPLISVTACSVCEAFDDVSHQLTVAPATGRLFWSSTVITVGSVWANADNDANNTNTKQPTAFSDQRNRVAKARGRVAYVLSADNEFFALYGIVLYGLYNVNAVCQI